MRSGSQLVVVAGSTETAEIDGITAAGSDRAARMQTPSVDAELCVYGRPVSVPTLPVSPSGTPTPALVTRAAASAADATVRVADAGLAVRTAAPTIDLCGSPGGDVQSPEPVPDAREIIERARTVGRQFPADRLVIGETIPAGTTTALGTLAALGAPEVVASSLPENPLARKQRIVERGLKASDRSRGDCAGTPVEAVRLQGDPVLAGVFGLATGAMDAGKSVVLGGGTQLATVAAMATHAGYSPPPVATTAFLAADGAIRELTDAIGCSLRVTDPAFEETHPATAGYLAGEAKEGVGMGGALAIAADAGVPPAHIRTRVIELYENVTGDEDVAGDKDVAGDENVTSEPAADPIGPDDA